MKHLLTIRQADIEPGFVVPEDAQWQDRYAARAVLFDDVGRVALLHGAKWDYYKLPGGGIEEEEDIEVALARELMEEVGAEAEVLGEVGRIEEWRVLDDINLHQISDCFMARVSGKIGQPNFTEEEIAEGFSVIWAKNLTDAVEKTELALDSPHSKTRFMSLRDTTFLRAALERSL